MEDEDVCPACEALDGTLFDATDRRVVPPLHEHCRCERVPIDDYQTSTPPEPEA
jgi:SPP1 gp7 family putative phage head morphogenesis protein